MRRPTLVDLKRSNSLSMKDLNGILKGTGYEFLIAEIQTS